MIGHEFLHSPGPTHIPDRVLNAMRRQPLDLVDARLKETARTCFEDLKDVFRTTGSVFVYAANGHGGWEAALANIGVPGDRVLVPEIGHFSHSWAEHARALGFETDVITGDWRRAVDPHQIEDRLRQDTEGRIKAVLAVQIDTGTGIATDIPAIRAAIDAAGHPALLVADTIASLAAMPFAMDEWGVDVAIAASQKALMCPPGLTILAANDKAVRACTALERRHRYWDWAARLGDEYYTKFCGTMPEHLFFALREALDIIAEQGLPAIVRRHRRIAGAVHGPSRCGARAARSPSTPSCRRSVRSPSPRSAPRRGSMPTACAPMPARRSASRSRAGSAPCRGMRSGSAISATSTSP
jgi:alanine-glyoxylate transaminase/serine-glyoxylate transaminase/serine-pyruvate transaminase